MKTNVTIILLILVVVTSSCSMKKAATTMTAKIITGGMSAVESESDLWIAKQSIVPMVKTLEVFNAGDPENQKFLALMAKVYGNVAFGFFEPRYLTAPEKEKAIWRGRIERYYRLGFEAGVKSLEKRFGNGVSGSVADFEKAVSKAKKNDLMLLFWTAFDLGNWVNLNRDDVTSVAMLPKVEAMINKVLEIDPEFGYGSALSFKAAMMSSRPKMLGGNPEKAAELFEESIKVSGGKYLMTRVMYAEWYAIPQNDNKLARRLLGEVMGADANQLPDHALTNELAKERAELLSKF